MSFLTPAAVHLTKATRIFPKGQYNPTKKNAYDCIDK